MKAGRASREALACTCALAIACRVATLSGLEQWSQAGEVHRLRGGGAAFPLLRKCVQKRENLRHEQVPAEGVATDGGFPAPSAKDGQVLEVGSLCMNCDAQGITRILPTTIPRFGQASRSEAGDAVNCRADACTCAPGGCHGL